MNITEIGQHATTIATDEKGVTRVTYHQTAVVAFSNTLITLDSGGWQANTTKNRMNQASGQFNLKYRVWQKDFNWFVDTPNGGTLPFKDGMIFLR